MIILDIETVPTHAALAAPYPVAEREPPANYKNPDAIARWHERDESDWREARVKECSLNPRLGRVLCIGIRDRMEVTATLYAEAEYDERAILSQFWQYDLHDRLTTWNGSWDLRFLVLRSLIAGVLPTVPGAVIRSWFRRYTTEPHFDCRAVLTNWERSDDTLVLWAAALGCESKLNGLDGSQVYPLFQAGEHAQIKAYCARDVALTADIYERIRLYFGGLTP